ncbi:MAG: ABC transporter ATP-binding protein [Acidiferrobacterales bacterium]
MEIGLEKVSKLFDSVRAIEDLDLVVRDGEMLALLGPSGCGKTTTLFAICGIHTVTTGRIRFDDRDVTHHPPQERNVGVVFQSYALYPHLTVHENIAFPLRIRRQALTEVDHKVRAIAETLHIESLLQRRPAQLSGGQQQRVALARALVRNPAVLLMDEPLANLDAALRLEMRSELRRIQRETGSTAILVTHDQAEAMSMCDRIALMNDGRIEQVATPTEIYDRPNNQFVAGFIGNPPIAFYRGSAAEGRFQGEALEFELPQRFKDLQAVSLTLGIRPEALQPDFTIAVEGRVAFVEPQGRETLYDLQLSDGEVLRSIQPGRQRFKLGERVRWGLDKETLLFFNAEGNRV